MIVGFRDRLERSLGNALAGLLAVLLVLVLANVAARYLFRTGFLGQEELAIWLHLALIALAMPLAYHGPLSMRFDVLRRWVPASFATTFDIAADTVSVTAALGLVNGALSSISAIGGVSPTLGLPEWIRFAFFVTGGLMLLVMLCCDRLLAGRIRGLFVSLVIAGLLYGSSRIATVDSDWPPSFFMALIAGVGLLVSAPLAHSFLAAACFAPLFGGALPEPALVSSAINGMSRFLLLSIPFFLLAGALLTVSGTAERLVTFAASLVGHRKGGLAQTVLLTSVIFSGASGSSVANAAFGASTFQPQLVRNGYPPAQAGAIIAASSVLDNVIPPSIAFLLLAAATNLSVGSLLAGGFVAGGLMALCLAIAISLSVKAGPSMQKASGRQRWSAARSAVPAFGLVIIVVAGIRFGVVTPTEAAALAAGFTLLLSFAARSASNHIWSCFRQSALEAGAIGLLIGSAAPFTFLLAVDGVAASLTEIVHSLGSSPALVLLMANLVLLVAGLVLDIGAAILLLGPILVPAAAAAGLDPIHFGVILVVNLMIHGLTPPLGMLIYVVSGVTSVPASQLFRAVLPYLAALLVSLFLLCLGTLVF